MLAPEPICTTFPQFFPFLVVLPHLLPFALPVSCSSSSLIPISLSLSCSSSPLPRLTLYDPLYHVHSFPLLTTPDLVSLSLFPPPLSHTIAGNAGRAKRQPGPGLCHKDPPERRHHSRRRRGVYSDREEGSGTSWSTPLPHISALLLSDQGIYRQHM